MFMRHKMPLCLLTLPTVDFAARAGSKNILQAFCLYPSINKILYFNRTKSEIFWRDCECEYERPNIYVHMCGRQPSLRCGN